MFAGIVLFPALLFSTVKPFLHFKQLASKDGLSSSHVTSVIQDQDGFLWIATTDGLNRYDGYHFQCYRSAQKDTASLIHNRVQTLFVDKTGALWVGTVRGIDRYSRDKDIFIPYLLNPRKSESNGCNSVQSFASDREGRLYTHSETGSIYRFDPAQDRFVLADSTNFGFIRKILIDKNNNLWIVGNRGLVCYPITGNQIDKHVKTFHFDGYSNMSITCLCEDDSTLWIGTQFDGLFTLQIQTGTISHVQPQHYKDIHIMEIIKDAWGRIWVADNSGLKLYDRESGLFYQYKIDVVDSQSHFNEAVSCVFVDHQGDVWCGSVLGGVHVSIKNKAFDNYGKARDKVYALSGKTVTALAEDSRGDLWIGYEAGGIDVIRDGVGKIRHYAPSTAHGAQLGPGAVFRILEDFNGDIWVGTSAGGLQRLDRRSDRFETFLRRESDSLSLGSNDVRWIEEDGRNGLWISTYGNGLNYFDRKRRIFNRIQEKALGEEIRLNLLAFMGVPDQDHVIWIATPGSLIQFSTQNHSARYFNSTTSDTTSLSDNYVLTLMIDSRQRIWVGTHEGLNILNQDRTKFRQILMRHGLATNMIKAIVEENEYVFWVSTNHGLSRLDLGRDSTMNYDIDDGLGVEEFSSRTAIKRKNGQLLFGGINGLIAFNPDSIQPNEHLPPVYITGLRINNQPVRIGEKIGGETILQKTIRMTDKIVLGYQYNMITFEYVGLNYIKSEKNRYACMLEGFQNDWIDMGEKREITFTNLKPGEYTFHVKACNNDGIWNETGASIGLTIRPPFWMTWPFRLVSAIFVILILLWSYQLRVLSYRKQNFALSTFNKQLESEISERKKVETRLNASLKEKEVLLKEVHHRVKNNMQIISSLLNLQVYRIKDPDLLEIFKGFQTRIRSMSLIYEKVYGSKDLANIDLSEYIKAVTRYLFVTYQQKRQIRLDIEIKDVVVPVNKALPCGLLVNELVSNSLKFAFPPSADHPDPAIKIVMVRENDQVRLTIDDNGVGYCDKEEDGGEKSFLGMNLVNLLVQDQLKGEMDIRCEHGTHYTIRFSV